MADITITVKEVRPPSPGKQKGVLIDASGKWWLVQPQDMNSFSPGYSYRITEFDTFTGNTGRTFYTIKQFQSIVNNGNGAAPRAPAPRTSSPPADDTARRMDIFVCGAFNNLLSNANVNPLDLKMMDMVSILNDLRSSWLGVFGPSPLPRQQPRKEDPISTSQQRSNGDMDDEIPF
jgi:hypothetical protein